MHSRWTKILVVLGGAAGVATTLLGFIVLAGWFTGNRTLIQVLPQFVPMQFNTALGFICCGLSLAFLVAGKSRIGAIIGAIAAIIGALTLVEYVGGVDLGIDELFMKHDITVGTSNPGRMAPNTAVCFTLFGLCGLVWQLRWKPIHRSVLVVILGSVTFGLGVVALTGYMAGLETAYGWGNLTRMAVHTSVGFVVVSCGLLFFIWSRDIRGRNSLPDWMPIPMGVAILTASVCLWQAMTAEGVRIQREHEDVTSISGLAILMLIVGMLLAMAMALAAFLAQQSARRSRAIIESNSALQREIIVRNQAEQDLQAHKDSLEETVAERTADLTRQTVEANLLHRAAEMAAETDSFEDAIQQVVHLVCEMIGWPVGHVYEPKPDSPGTLASTTIWHIDDPDRYEVFRQTTERTGFQIGEGLPGRILESGESVWIVDVGADRNFRRNQVGSELGVKSAFGFPVTVQSEVVAILEFFTDTEAPADENLLRVMSNVGEQLGRIFERKRAADEIREARKAAESANRAKSAFLANMSHELRTPMNAIIGYSEMLMEEAEDLDQKEFIPDLSKINQAGKHLLNLINDILDLSKIEAGKMELYLERFDVAPMLDDVTATVESLVKKNNNTMQVRCEADLGSMNADLTKIRQVLFNLISNASKFAKDGVITIAAERVAEPTGDRLCFHVTDTGIGIAADKIDKLFQEFTQADASTTRQFGGTGLGLAISRRFCRLMGGDISVKSELGKGSTFSVWIPAEVRPVSDTDDDQSASEDSPVRVDAAKGCILVIDDDPGARELLKRSLAKDGFAVVTAGDGDEGLRIAREQHPTAITLDVMMPGQDGWAVLRELKADPQLQNIPVIMVTMVDEQNMGYTLGAAEYMTKPVDRNRLCKMLEKYQTSNTTSSVLLIEDDPEVREYMRRTFEKQGWTVTEAENGRVALESLKNQIPALITLDLMMPVMDGFEFVYELRKVEAWRQIPIVVVTAKDLTNEDRQQLSGNVQKIVEKGSYSREQLLKDVSNFVADCNKDADGGAR